MAPQTNTEYDEALDTSDEYQEVEGGNFPRTFYPGPAEGEDGDLEGTFVSSEEKLIKGKQRVIHTFRLKDTDETVTVWGAAILDSRLQDIQPGSRVKVVKTGKKLQSQTGNTPWEYKLFVAKGSISQAPAA